MIFLKRILMISDIHGCYDPFLKLLEKVDYRPDRDTLVLLGDYVDRGPMSKETVEQVKKLVIDHHVIALRGNHDQRLVDLIRTDDAAVQAKFLEHGGLQTLQSYCDFIGTDVDQELLNQARIHIQQNFIDHIEFLEALPLYHEDPHHIYVHAGINPSYAEWRTQPDYDFMYIKKEFHDARLDLDKPVVFGHTRAIELHDSADVWFQDDKIGIDGGCAYGMQLNCLIYENGIYSTVNINNTK
ncbi:metallophosphoesterase [Paenibacillus solani]|uniref:metallophosphoesterase n=1 Tax=Paenibacillus solani TaxID=1705565 RepID=UPI003D29A2D4